MLAATLGSAVGLGNIWKFPYLTGENGGAGFLLVYVIATLLVGLPVMISGDHAGARGQDGCGQRAHQAGSPRGNPGG